MKSLYCDVCKHEIEEPVVTRNYYYIREYDLCEACKDTIDARLKPIVKSHAPFSAEWYEQQVMSFIEKGVATSKP